MTELDREKIMGRLSETMENICCQSLDLERTRQQKSVLEEQEDQIRQQLCRLFEQKRCLEMELFGAES